MAARALLTVIAALAACTADGATGTPGVSAVPSSSVTGPTTTSSPTAAAASPSAAVTEVPAAFPLPAGAVEVPDPTGAEHVLGSWHVEMQGPDLYRFFLAELPAAGFEVVGEYPGGAVAVIVFELESGDRLQVSLETNDDLDSSEFQLLPAEES
jgi:hypothetical protein